MGRTEIWRGRCKISGDVFKNELILVCAQQVLLRKNLFPARNDLRSIEADSGENSGF